jgi:hypothetical protein
LQPDRSASPGAFHDPPNFFVQFGAGFQPALQTSLAHFEVALFCMCDHNCQLDSGDLPEVHLPELNRSKIQLYLSMR